MGKERERNERGNEKTDCVAGDSVAGAWHLSSGMLRAAGGGSRKTKAQ